MADESVFQKKEKEKSKSIDDIEKSKGLPKPEQIVKEDFPYDHAAEERHKKIKENKS